MSYRLAISKVVIDPEMAALINVKDGDFVPSTPAGCYRRLMDIHPVSG
jgi:hypothetical protein